MARTTLAISTVALALALATNYSAATFAKAPGNWPMVKFDGAPVTVRFPNDYIRIAGADGTLRAAPSKDSNIVLELSLQDTSAMGHIPDLGHGFIRYVSQKKKLKPRRLGNKLFITEREPHGDSQHWMIGFDDVVVVFTATIKTGMRNSPEVQACLREVVPNVIDSLSRSDARQPGDVVERRGQPAVVQVSDDDDTMNRAINEARATVDQFIAALNAPQPSQQAFSVKLLVSDGQHSEHMWVTPVRYEQGKFFGQINNVPDLVRGVTLGDEVSVPANEISDWMFVDRGRLIGGFTIRVLRDGLSPGEKRQFDRSVPFKFE
jgi:uncharacterized protein YegJ (DUF2314 family)